MQPVVILLIAGSAMFIMIGGLSLLSHYYTLNGIKSRTVGDGQYGTARFATPKEIAETYESMDCQNILKKAINYQMLTL